MNRVGKQILAIATLMVCTVWCVSAEARPQYWTVFEREVVKKKAASDDPKAKAFAEVASDMKNGRCLVCHGKNERTGRYVTKRRNSFGQALQSELPKFELKRWTAEKAKCQEELLKALDKVWKLPSEKDNEKSLTFGEIVSQGQMPGKDVPADGAGDDEAEEDSDEANGK